VGAPGAAAFVGRLVRSDPACFEFHGADPRVACAIQSPGRILAGVIERLHRARVIQGAVLALAVLAATTPVDEIVQDFVFRHVVSHEARLLANGFTLLGTTEVATVGLLGLAGVAHRAADVAMWQAAVGGVAGVLLAGLSTQVVKHVACRARPRVVDGWGVGALPGAPARLGFFYWPCFGESHYQGFPSGHAATAFAVAAALAGWAPVRRRGWILAAASGVGVSRIVLNAHFLSDVLGGGLIGWWAGEAGVLLVGRYLAPRWRARTQGSAPRRRAAA
jgi:membrane-associated phospholipid phosphatase